MPARVWDDVPAAYMAAAPRQFIGEPVEVIVPARGDRPARFLSGVLSDVVLLTPGVTRVRHLHRDGSLCQGISVLTVTAPLVQLFVAGTHDVVVPTHLVRVLATPSALHLP
ncbi:hypothetical protein [Cellulosimicrobium sp. SL-1]|uniref:hypothetical protein n=1 Tax=Cellulosimicrobium sp. SL-1 TaxID=2699423 RepID=UPI0013D0694F|nr:hypothetical protein [Cellulosimicrobium sp. SL-1]